MQISFFEEFPSKQNLAKLEYVNWDTKLYLAAKSLKEFEKIKKQVNIILNKRKGKYKTKVKEYIYWPILEKKEGYWISPFSKKKALKRIFRELKSSNVPVMLDLEYPTTKNILLYFTVFNFFRNKKLIKDFVNSYQGNVYFAEYHFIGKRKQKFLQWLGLHYNVPKAKVIKMLYHSLKPLGDKFFEKMLTSAKKENPNVTAGFGTIAKGIFGFEPILAPAKLETDLKAAKETKVKEIVIFRLGGMNKKYEKVIEEFV